MDAQTFGFILLILGAVCGGSFGLPSKFVKKETPWETLWGPFFLFVTVLLPVVTFPLIAKGLFATCAKAGFDVIVMRRNTHPVFNIRLKPMMAITNI